MKMSNEKKKDVLLKNFEILNKNFGTNGDAISEIVVKMFSIDLDLALDMWKHLLEKYENEISGNNSRCLTGIIYYNGAEIIGFGKMDSIILNTPELKRVIFSLSSSVYISATVIIKHILEKDEVQLANELLQLLFDNPYKDKSWYYIMDDIMLAAGNDISSEMYELLEMWCDKVENEEERAKLSVKMLDYIE